MPELHDIGKLVKNDLMDAINIKKGHTFISFDFNKFNISRPDSPSWYGQYHEMSNDIKELDFNEWPTDIAKEFRKDLFLLIIADHLASSISRSTLDKFGKRPPSEEGIYKLWNKEFYIKTTKKGNVWYAFKDLNDLRKLFDEEIQNCLSGEDFLKKYKNYLLLTPEDKYAPLNITSLYSHNLLVGKIYNIFTRIIKIDQEQDGSSSFNYNNIKVKKIKDAEGGLQTHGVERIEKGKWQAKLIKSEIRFPHSFVRLQDINLIRKREELINEFVNSYKEETLFSSSNFICLFLPSNINIEELFQPFLEFGFYIDIIEIVADLGILNSIIDKKKLKAKKDKDQDRINVLENRETKIKKKILNPIFKNEMSAPLCDICQQNEAKESKKDNIKEWLCDNCNKIRNLGDPFKDYGTIWQAEGIKVCWFKFTLDQKKLEQWLQETFENYVKVLNLKSEQTLIDEFRSLALQIDFNNDYKEMLETFWKEFENLNEFNQPIQNYRELGVFKYSPEISIKVLKKYLEAFLEFFPDCKGDHTCPINLSLSIANIKYPIREHYKFFEQENKNFLNITYYNTFIEEYSKDELTIVIDIILNQEPAKSFLYKLTQLYDELNSNLYLTVEIADFREKFPELLELISKGTRPSKILNLYNILEEGKQYE